MGELKGTLGYPVILLITINSIMGTGIFFLPALGAKMSGSASILSWIILSVISIYIAMCFGELASMFPKSGGIYEFCKQAYGNFFSFVIGWATLIVGNVTIAMLVVGAIRYLNPGLPDFIKIGVSLFFIFLFNFMAYKGMKTSSFMLVTFSIITLSSIFGLIIPGIFSFNIGNISPLMSHSWTAVFITIFFIAETFFGWETVTFLAEDTKDPERVIPKALVNGTVIIAIICVLFVIISLGVIPWEVFSKSLVPLSDLSSIFYGSKGSLVFTLLVYLSIIGSVAGWVVSAPRLILALAKDRLFLAQCAKIHPKNNTPHIAILFQTILTSILIVLGAGSYETLLELLLPLVLIIYSFTLLTVVILRFKMPDLKRPYKAPAGVVGPILVVLFMMCLVVYWLINIGSAIHTLKLALSFILLGIPLFFLLNFYYNPDAIKAVLDKFSRFKFITERFELPRKIRDEVFLLLGDVKGKNVLEHGCSIGTLTLDLSEKVGPSGKIYATNISRGEIDVLQTRLDKNEIFNVYAIHDEHHTSRIHPDVPKVDIFVSVGSLGYTQDIKKIASEIYWRLPIGGKVVIVEYIDLYKLMPNAGWLRKLDKIEEIFIKHGFSVRVVKRKGLLWNYLFVYGVKSKMGEVPYI
jgi:amino acid transporter/phospholipid N-methyltransferase